MTAMSIQQYVVSVCATNCYFAINDDTREVLIIDPGASAKQLAEKVNEHSKNCKYMATLEECASYLKEHVSNNDIVLTIGAGTVTKIGRELLK